MTYFSNFLRWCMILLNGAVLDLKNLSNRQQKRWIGVDHARSFAIVMMVFFHASVDGCDGKEGWFVHAMSWYRMPILFIVSGIFVVKTRDIFSYTAKRFKRLMLPYVAFKLAWIIPLLFLGFGNFKEWLESFLLMNGNGSTQTHTWFIPPLFLANVFAAGIWLLGCGRRNLILVIAVGLIAVGGSFMLYALHISNANRLFMSLDLIPLLVGYVLLGAWLGSSLTWTDRMTSSFEHNSFRLVALFLALLGLFVAYYAGWRVSLYSRILPTNLLAAPVLALTAVALIFALSWRIPYVFERYFLLLGQTSMFVFLYHYFLLRRLLWIFEECGMDLWSRVVLAATVPLILLPLTMYALARIHQWANGRISSKIVYEV